MDSSFTAYTSFHRLWQDPFNNVPHVLKIKSEFVRLESNCRHMRHHQHHPLHHDRCCNHFHNNNITTVIINAIVINITTIIIIITISIIITLCIIIIITTISIIIVIKICFYLSGNIRNIKGRKQRDMFIIHTHALRKYISIYQHSPDR